MDEQTFQARRDAEMQRYELRRYGALWADAERDVAKERRQLAAQFIGKADNLHVLNDNQLAGLVERAFKVADMLLEQERRDG